MLKVLVKPKVRIKMIVVTNLKRKYPSGVIGLDGVSFTAAPNSITAIIGPSGAGKTSVLRMIAGLEIPDEGEILNPYGQPGMVFQQPSLWPHMTLLKNTSLPLRILKGISKQKAEKSACDLLEKFGLSDRLHSYPAELSGGEQQRGTIARAWLLEPSVLCLDEITSALDPETSAIVLAFLKEFKQRALILLVTHKLGFVRSCADHVILMDCGRVIESGSSDDIFSKPKMERGQLFIKAARYLSEC